MTENEAPPTPLPPAAQSPYPAHPAPQAHDADESDSEQTAPLMPPDTGPAIGALGVTLIGGAVAAAVGLLIAIPLFRRRPQAKPAGRKSGLHPRRARRKTE